MIKPLTITWYMALLLVVAFGAMTSADATTPASEKKIVKQILSNGGIEGNSATFTEVGTFGETIVGVSQSGTYLVSQGFWNPESTPSCCVGLVGNIDCDPADAVDVTDLTVLIDYLFISFRPLCCTAEAYFGPEVAGAPMTQGYRPDIAALTAMIDYLFVNFAPLPSCP